MAKLNLGRVGLVPQGTYDSTKTYAKLDVVFYPATGSSYVSLIDNNSAAPSDATKWQSLADVSNEVAAANAATARANAAAEAAEAVSGEVADLNNAVAQLDGDIYEAGEPDNPDYKIGNFSISSGTITAIKTAVVTQSIIQARYGSKIKPDAGYQIKVAIYADSSESSFVKYIGWTEEEVTLDEDGYIRVAIANVEHYGDTLTDTSYSAYINWGLRTLKNTALSDFANDVGYVTGDTVPQFQRTVNLFNPVSVVVGSLVYSNGTVKASNTNFRTSDFIPVTGGLNYIGDYTNHICWYDSAKTYISGTNMVFSAMAPNNAAYCRIDINTDSKSVNDVMLVQDTVLPAEYIPYYEPLFVVPYRKTTGITYSALQPWKGKNVLFYGDSVTSQINGDTPASWGARIYNALSLAGVHGRGVGGQTYFWNNGTFKVDTDGNYVSRGGADDNCLGCFPSWQRISSMIPDAIKSTIDAVIIMGGTNDIDNVEEQTGTGTIEWTVPTWSPENDTDTDWVNATEYNGGDYDVSAFTGAIASTIMKLQARCPNAKIIIASPLSRWNTTNHTPYAKNNVSMQDMVEIERKTADYMSVPFININALCGINGWNYSTYITDGVHPNTAGGKKLASAMLSGFESIYPELS